MPIICKKYAEKNQRYTQIIQKMYQKYAKNMLMICQRYAKDMQCMGSFLSCKNLRWINEGERGGWGEWGGGGGENFVIYIHPDPYIQYKMKTENTPSQCSVQNVPLGHGGLG